MVDDRGIEPLTSALRRARCRTFYSGNFAIFEASVIGA
jgi:hypothetical protein